MDNSEHSKAMTPSQERPNLQTAALIIIASAVVVVGLNFLRPALVPLTLALFVTFLAAPLVDWLEVRARLPRMVSVLTAFLLVILGVVAFGILLVAAIARAGRRVSHYQEQLITLAGRIARALADWGIELGQIKLMDELRQLPVLDWFQGAVGGMLGMIGNSLLILIFALYLMSARSPQIRLEGYWAEIERTVRTYVGTKLGTSFATALLTWGLMSLFGLDMAVLFAMLTFLLNFVPNIGSIIAVLLPLPIAFLQFELGTALTMVALLTAIQQLVGNLVEPKLMGEGLGLHPVTILTALVVWGLVWGLPGMLLSGPLTVMVRVLLERYETTRPMACLMRGKLQGAC